MLVIAVYAICQAPAFDQAAIDEVLNGENTAQLLNLYPPDLVSKIREMLPRLVPLSTESSQSCCPTGANQLHYGNEF